MAALRVFISHASGDSVFAERLATDLRNAGADVWLDSSHLTGSGDFVARISQALNERDVLILVLSPAAIASQWVPDEMNAAIVRAKQGYMRPPLVVQCADVPLRDIPGLWTTYQRVDMMRDYGSALSRVLVALALRKPVSSPPPIKPTPKSTPVMPLTRPPIPVVASPPHTPPLRPMITSIFPRVIQLGVILAGIGGPIQGFLLGRLVFPLDPWNRWYVSLIGDSFLFITVFLGTIIGGFRTFKESHRFRASLVMGITVGFIVMLLVIAGDYTYSIVHGQPFDQDYLNAFYVLLAPRYIGLACVIGLGGSALGGLVGRWRAAAH